LDDELRGRLEDASTGAFAFGGLIGIVDLDCTRADSLLGRLAHCFHLAS
ncbi:MAG: hypothetical protein GX481_01530, partial [Atopobium sp.]|nr:hypothetical protein [Atopobium sp.]